MSLAPRSPHVVVLGSGYAGLPCALELGKAAGSGGTKRLRVTLINREPRQELVTELYRALRSGRPELYPFLKATRRHGVQFVEGTIHEIDPAKGSIKVRGERTQSIRYDELVIALGSKARVPTLEGLQELLDGNAGANPEPEARLADKRVFFFRNNTQIQSLRLALRRVGWGPEPRPGGRDLFCVVLGAGSTGLEVAGELAAFRGRNAACRIVLVDAKHEILPDFPVVARNLFRRDLKRARVESVLGSPAVRITENEITIQNGQVIPWDLLILCTGGRPPTLLKAFGSSLTPSGLLARDDLEIGSFPHHHVIGDLAALESRETPKTAQFAAQSGRFAAEKIARRLVSGVLGRSSFDPQDFGYLVSFGPYRGVGRIGAPPSKALTRFISPFVFGPAIDELKRAAKIRYLWSVR